MGKLIDADTCKEYLKRVLWGADIKIDNWVDSMPAVDAVPVVHARAMKQSPFGVGSRYCIWKTSHRCSNCGEYVSDIWNYCPNCMAKLDGGEGNATD